MAVAHRPPTVRRSRTASNAALVVPQRGMAAVAQETNHNNNNNNNHNKFWGSVGAVAAVGAAGSVCYHNLPTGGEDQSLWWPSLSIATPTLCDSSFAAPFGSVSSSSSSSSSKRSKSSNSSSSSSSSFLSSPSEAKTTFDLLVALDAKEEMEKVRLAQIIHDLHDLATEKKGLLRRYVTMAQRRVTREPGREPTETTKPESQPPKQPQAQEPPQPIKFETKRSLTSSRTSSSSSICMEGVDWKHLSRDHALHLLDGIAAGCLLEVHSLLQLLQAATEVLAEEDNLIDLSHHTNQVISVVGDLHGSMRSLTHLLHKTSLQQLLDGKTDNDDDDDNKKKQNIVVFDGDFVDRGEQSLEVLLTLLILKLAFPKQVYLVRGNHEDVMVASVYGFQDEIRLKYPNEAPNTKSSSNQEATPDVTHQIWSAMGRLFGAFPLALQTPTALVVHGGLPYDHFELDTLRKLPKEFRQRMKTSVKPQTEVEKLVTGLLWSDPATSSASSSTVTAANPRGLGIVFGKEVARGFLERHNLMYLVRGHQVVADGVRDQHCGRDDEGNATTSVLTVFSAAAYPAETGSNQGAVLHLLPTGAYQTESYSYSDIFASTQEAHEEMTEHALTKVRKLIGCHRSQLEQAFSKIQSPEGTVTIDEWAQVMSSTIVTAEGMPWATLQPRLAPAASSFWSSTTISVQDFLQAHTLRLHRSDSIDKTQHHAAETLAQNSEMLMTVFKFLDINGDDKLSPKEFRTGVQLLNKRLPKERQLQDADELFQALDEDGNGEISFEEFTHGFGMSQ